MATAYTYPQPYPLRSGNCFTTDSNFFTCYNVHMEARLYIQDGRFEEILAEDGEWDDICLMPGPHSSGIKARNKRNLGSSVTSAMASTRKSLVSVIGGVKRCVDPCMVIPQYC